MDDLVAKIAALVAPELLKEHKKLLNLARMVVFARHYDGDDGWSRLKEAIGDLEGAVGRPKTDPYFDEVI